MPKIISLSFLWTDILVFFLIMLVSYYFIKMVRYDGSWKKMFLRPSQVVSCLIFLVYVLIGLLDCIHFKTESNLISLLDIILNPIQYNTELSYSEPFATKLFSTMPIKTEQGIIWDYPDLKYVNDVNSFWTIAKSIFQSIFLFLIFFLVSFIVFNKKYKTDKKKVLNKILNHKKYAIKTFYLTSFFIILIFLLSYNFMFHVHILGTDKVGYDVFYIGIKSIRTGLIIGTVTTIFMLPIAISLGVLAGYFQGIIDDIIQFIYTTLSSIPGVLLIAASVLTVQVMLENTSPVFSTLEQRADIRLLMLCFILGITSWTGLCRLIRAETMKVKQLPYVQAAIALGVSNFKIMKNHILPNVMHLILITIVLDFSGLVLAEAVLSYVGVGVDPTSYSWGNMINSARLEMSREPAVWWSLLASFTMMLSLVLSVNIISDGIRDILDPRTKHG